MASNKVTFKTEIKGLCYVFSSNPMECPLCGETTVPMRPHSCVKEVRTAIEPARSTRKRTKNGR